MGHASNIELIWPYCGRIFRACRHHVYAGSVFAQSTRKTDVGWCFGQGGGMLVLARCCAVAENLTWVE